MAHGEVDVGVMIAVDIGLEEKPPKHVFRWRFVTCGGPVCRVTYRPLVAAHFGRRMSVSKGLMYQ